MSSIMWIAVIIVVIVILIIMVCMRAILAHSLYKEEEVEEVVEHFKQIVKEHGITREAHYENVRKRNIAQAK